MVLLTSDWQERLKSIIEAMREMSLQTDPVQMVKAYGTRVRQLMPADRWISLSRRGLDAPEYRITRSSTWTETIDPWNQKDRLPHLVRRFLERLDLRRRAASDRRHHARSSRPTIRPREYLDGMRSLIAVPHYDQGDGLNMVVSMREEAASFDPERFPEWVWVSSLFGRATHNLVLRNELKQAYDIVERELKVVADIQRSLLPQVLPKIPNLELAAYYRTSRWAGGDYYDFFAVAGRPLGDPGGGRQRPWNAGGRDDGDLPQPGA